MKKGFTLIELLIVIAILAILTTTVVLVLNPAQMLAEARDTQRMADLDSVRSAISLYLVSTSTPLTATTRAEIDTACAFNSGCPAALTNDYAVTGSGWVGVNLGGISGGSPLSILPRDPSGIASYHYAYKSDGTYFELNGRLESGKQRGKMTTDGGDSNTCPTTYTEVDCWYEIGTSVTL